MVLLLGVHQVLYHECHYEIPPHAGYAQLVLVVTCSTAMFSFYLGELCFATSFFDCTFFFKNAVSTSLLYIVCYIWSVSTAARAFVCQ